MHDCEDCAAREGDLPDPHDVMRVLRNLERRIHQMTLDLTALTTTEKALVAAVESLILLQKQTQQEVVSISANLAAAIAANNPTVTAALQAQVDALKTDMQGEVDHIVATLQGAAPGPTGGTGTTGPAGTTGETGPSLGVTGL